MTQVIDNFTVLRGKHAYKIGFDWQHVYDERTAAPQFLYTFPTTAVVSGRQVGPQPVQLHRR